MFHPQWSYRPEEWCIILDRSTGEATANNHIKQEIGEAGTSERCFTVQCFHTTAVKLHSYVFQGSTEKNITISENIFDRTFFKLVKSSIHWPDRVLFPCFESSSFTLYFHYDQSTFVACLMQLRCCLNHAKTPTPKSACFAAQAFVLLSKMRVFASTAFLFLTIAKSVGGESFFVTSAHFHFIDDGFYFLRAMISSDTK